MSNQPLLPIVNPEILESVYADAKRDREYTSKLLDRMVKENPTIAAFIAIIMQQSSDIFGIQYVGTLVYRMLESQAEADKMSGELERKV